MIKPEDANLHPPDSDAATWAETNFFGFYVPEAKLNIGLYVLVRPNLGTALSTICMNSRRTKVHWEAEYCDMQMHLPMGKDFDLQSYELANGLKVVCTEPNMNWNLDYDDGEGTEVHVTYASLMPPFDIHDPEQDPMVPKDDSAGFAWGTAYNGHFDQTGHFQGEVTLRGQKHAVDCVSTMDHSWGPRQERHAHEMSWLHAHFAKDFALHGIFSFDPGDQGTVLSLAHGYILENGKVYGLRAGTGKTVRNGWFPEEKHLEVTDSRDKTHTFTGLAQTSFPWHAWPNVVGFNALMRWTNGEGRNGWGETQDFLGMGTLCELAG